MTEQRFEQLEAQAAHLKKYGKRSGEWATSEESFCGPDGGLHELVAELRKLREGIADHRYRIRAHDQTEDIHKATAAQGPNEVLWSLIDD